MKQLSIILAIALVGTLAACSSKKKAAKTTPTDTADTSGADKSTKTGDTSSAVGDTTGDASKPASLGTVIYFEFDKAALGDDAKTTLDNNATWMKEDPSRTITIEGHTDEVGTPEYNLALGQRRAQATRDYLVRLGVDETRVKVITYGEERPASGADSENRRSVFVATRKQ